MEANHSDLEESGRTSNQCLAHTQPSDVPGPGERVEPRSWFKRPSLAWILWMKILSSLALSVTAGPRVEIYTQLVCTLYHPGLIETPGGLTQIFSTSQGATAVLDSGTSLVEVYLPQDYPAVPTDSSPSLLRVSMRSLKRFESCASDPRVQAEVARLAGLIAVIGGVLSCFTAGWWGGFLDRYGRTRTMGMIVLGPLVNDLLTMFVFRFSGVLPGKYWFLVITPVLEGIMGSPSSTMAAETSYMRDISEPQTLARNFSLLVGIFYAGGTIGPVLGGLVNERTGSVISALYAAIALHIAYCIVAWVALPESITQGAMMQARRRYEDELVSCVDADVSPLRRQVLVLSKSFWDSFPLNVLAPKPSTNSQRKNDWGLTCLAVSAGLINVVLGSSSSMYQYALYTFGWSSLDLGYFISASGLSTVVFLMGILPAILRVSRRVLVTRPTEYARQNALFDLHLVRVSSLIFTTAYALMGIAPTGIVFTLCFILSSFGQGFLPGTQSVATILHTNLSGENDTGRLFGALAVVYVLGGRIIGPALYGTVYAATVSSIPSAVFWLSAACSLTAFLVLAFIRLPDPNPDTQNTGLHPDRIDPESEPLLGQE